MRTSSGIFSLILVLFALVQYNDPDFLLWFTIYAIAAVWCGMAAFKPRLVADNRVLRILFGISFVIAVFGTLYLWPYGADWWTKEVIWDNELVREGLGMAIATVGLVLAGLVCWQPRRAVAAE